MAVLDARERFSQSVSLQSQSSYIWMFNRINSGHLLDHELTIPHYLQIWDFKLTGDFQPLDKGTILCDIVRGQTDGLGMLGKNLPRL
jgi:hypothetical protein